MVLTSGIPEPADEWKCRDFSPDSALLLTPLAKIKKKNVSVLNSFMAIAKSRTNSVFFLAETFAGSSIPLYSQLKQSLLAQNASLFTDVQDVMYKISIAGSYKVGNCCDLLAEQVCSSFISRCINSLRPVRRQHTCTRNTITNAHVHLLERKPLWGSMFLLIKSKLTCHAACVSLEQAAMSGDNIALDFSHCHLLQMGIDTKSKEGRKKKKPPTLKRI